MIFHLILSKITDYFKNTLISSTQLKHREYMSPEVSPTSPSLQGPAKIKCTKIGLGGGGGMSDLGTEPAKLHNTGKITVHLHKMMQIRFNKSAWKNTPKHFVEFNISQ